MKQQLDKFMAEGDYMALVMPTVHLVVKDPEAFVNPIADRKNNAGDSMMTYNWRCGFDADTPKAEKTTTAEIQGLLRELEEEENSGIDTWSVCSREEQRESFYDMYGSLFFLGIMLSIVFLLAAVLIIYYKQICEDTKMRPDLISCKRSA